MRLQELAAKELAENGPEWAKARLSVVTRQRTEAQTQLEQTRKEAERYKQQYDSLAARLESLERRKGRGRDVDEDDSIDFDDDDKPARTKGKDDDLRVMVQKLLSEKENEKLIAKVHDARSKYPHLPQKLVATALQQGWDLDEISADVLESLETTRTPSSKPKTPPPVAGRASSGSSSEPRRQRQNDDKPRSGLERVKTSWRDIKAWVEAD